MLCKILLVGSIPADHIPVTGNIVCGSFIFDVLHNLDEALKIENVLVCFVCAK